MSSSGGEVSFSLQIHHRGLWLAAMVEVAGQVELNLIVDTGSTVSGISQGVQDRLESIGLLEPAGFSWGRSPVSVLRNLSIDAQAIPDMQVHRSNRATLLGIDGIIGLQYLTQFRRVTFDVPDLRLTLTP